MYMKLFYLLILLCFTVPAGAVPSLTDLDSWQLPDEEEEKPAPKPAPKPVASKTTAASAHTKEKGPELEVQLATNFGLASSTRDASEIAVMRHSAEQLLSRLKGKTRFYVLFNANMPASVDKVIQAEDGQEYAVVLFGNEKQNYRLFLFKGGVEQPLLAVAENTAGKLDMYRQYQVNVGVTEEDFKKAEPEVVAQIITEKETQTPYQVYPFKGPWYVVFKNGNPVRQFTQESLLKEYTNKLQGLDPASQVVTGPDRTTRWLQTQTKSDQPQKRLFSEIVDSGTLWDRKYGLHEEENTPWGPSARFSQSGRSPKSTRSSSRSRRR